MSGNNTNGAYDPSRPDEHGRWTWPCPACTRLNVPIREPRCVYCGTPDPLAPSAEQPTTPSGSEELH